MRLRKAIYRLTAIGFTSTVLLSLSGIAANAATFNLSYTFRNSSALFALLEGGLTENSNRMPLSERPSAIVTENTSNLLELEDPESLVAKGSIRLDSGFASLAIGSHVHNEADTVGLTMFSLTMFNSARVGPREFSVVNLAYQSNQGNVNLAEAFTNNAFAFHKRDIPEKSSTNALFIALAGLGLAAVKKHRNRQAS